MTHILTENTNTMYQVTANLSQQVIVEMNSRPEPEYEVPVGIGIPLWGAWGFGDSVKEAIENLVFADPLYPSEEEKAVAKTLYGAVKAAHPELTPSPDPAWWEG